MNQVWTIFMLGGLLGAVATGLLIGLIWAIVFVIKRLKPWVLLMDEEGGKGFHGRAKVKDGQIITGKGEDIKRYPLNESSRVITNSGPLYVLGMQTGANLSCPNKEGIRLALEGDKGAVLLFDVVDPGLLGRTYARRMAQETVDAQMEKDDWKKTAILPLSIVAGLAVVGLVIAAIAFATGG